MIDENLFKKSISFWNLKNDEFELLVYDSPYKVLNRRNEVIVILK